MKMKIFVLIMMAIASEHKKLKTSNFIGVTFTCRRGTPFWRAQRWSQIWKTMVSNGHHDDEEAAARASDTLARKLIKNGESHLLNFSSSSNYIGVTYNKKQEKWQALRWNKNTNKAVNNGAYDDEETAAHASDTLARILMGAGNQKHTLNFPNDLNDVYPHSRPQSSSFVGVSYCKRTARWVAFRRSKSEKKMIYNGSYKDEETAAHASDELARRFIKNGEQKHKLNFPDDVTVNQMNKRKRANLDFDAGASSEDVDVISKELDSFKAGLEIDMSTFD